MIPRILVTGAGGQLGQALLALGEPGTMIGLDRAACDLADPTSIAQAISRHRPSAVINAAAYTAVDGAEDHEAAAFAVNAEGAGRLAGAAAAAGAALIHLSTDYVFDGSGGRPRREQDTPAPINAYGRTKLAGERLVMEAHPGACVVRTSWVHATTGHNFVRTMLTLARTRDRVTVVDDQLGSPTFAPDLAAALLKLLTFVVEGKAPPILHLSGAGQTSWFGLAEAIFTGLRARGIATAALEPVPAAHWPAKARRPLNSVLDCGLASHPYGLIMPDWRDGLRRSLDILLDAQKPSRG